MLEDVQSFSFLGLTVYKYGLALAIAAAAWLMAAGFLASKRKMPEGTVLLAGTLAVPLGLLFARVFFCLISLGYFLDTIGQPAAMLYFWDGGLSMMGALFGVSLAALIAARIKKIRFGTLADVLAASAGLFIAIARLGEKFTTLGRGRSIGVEWMRESTFFGIRETWSDDVFHAVFRYEAAVAAMILLVMLCLYFGKKTKAKAMPGDLALIFGTLFGSAQVVLESLRDDGHLLWGFVRASQIISILLPVAALTVFSIRFIHRKGLSKGLVLAWLAAAGSIVLAVVKEFDIDTSSNLVRDYGLMSLAMAVLCAAVLLLWKFAANKRKSA